MKNITITMGVILMAGSLLADVVTDNFDWGSGVTGRESITGGATIDGVGTQTGGQTWAATVGSAVFSGNAGSGNGSLLLSNGTTGNAEAIFSYAPTGVVVAMAEGQLAASGSGSPRQFGIGFQTASPNVPSIFSQDSDRIYGSLYLNGTLNFNIRLAGTTISSTGDGAISAISQDDIVRMTLTMDVLGGTSSLSVTNLTAGTSGTKTLSWTGDTSSLAAFAVGTGGGLQWDAGQVSVSTIPEPASLGLLMIGASMMLAIRRISY